MCERECVCVCDGRYCDVVKRGWWIQEAVHKMADAF